MQLIDYIEKGTWPVAGGLLDQSAWLVDAVEYFRRELLEAKNE